MNTGNLNAQQHSTEIQLIRCKTPLNQCNPWKSVDEILPFFAKQTQSPRHPNERMSFVTKVLRQKHNFVYIEKQSQNKPNQTQFAGYLDSLRVWARGMSRFSMRRSLPCEKTSAGGGWKLTCEHKNPRPAPIRLRSLLRERYAGQAGRRVRNRRQALVDPRSATLGNIRPAARYSLGRSFAV